MSIHSCRTSKKKDCEALSKLMCPEASVRDSLDRYNTVTTKQLIRTAKIEGSFSNGISFCDVCVFLCARSVANVLFEMSACFS